MRAPLSTPGGDAHLQPLAGGMQHRAGRTRVRLLERDGDRHLQTTARGPLTRAPAGVGEAVEEVAEVAEAVEVRECAEPGGTAATGARVGKERVRRGARTGASAALHLVCVAPVLAEPVVLLPGVGVREHLVRLVDLLEPRLGVRVAVVDVRMMLAREAAVRGAYLLLSGVLRDAQRVVVVLRHVRCSIRVSCSTYSIANLSGTVINVGDAHGTPPAGRGVVSGGWPSPGRRGIRAPGGREPPVSRSASRCRPDSGSGGAVHVLCRG